MATFSFTNLPVVGTSTANEAANRIVTSFTELATHINSKKVGTDNIEDGAIGSGKLVQSTGVEAVVTAAIRAGAVTDAKLSQVSGAEAVTSLAIRDGAVTTVKIGAGQVTAPKLAITPYVEVTRTTSANLTTTSPAGDPFTWQSATTDTGIASGGATAMWSNATPTQISIVRDGVYAVEALFDLDVGSSNLPSAITVGIVKVNSAQTVKTIVARDYARGEWNSTSQWSINPSGIVALAAGDLLEVWIRQVGGTAKSMTVQTPSSTTPLVASPVVRVAWLGRIS